MMEKQIEEKKETKWKLKCVCGFIACVTIRTPEALIASWTGVWSSAFGKAPSYILLFRILGFVFSGEPLVLLQHVWITEFPLLPNTQPYSTIHNIPSCPFHSPFSLQLESQLLGVYIPV